MNDVLYSDKDFQFTYEFQGKAPIVHLTIDNWNKTSLKRMREVMELIVARFGAEGHDVLFATTQDKKAVRLWNLVLPADEVVPLKQGNTLVGWLGAWYTE